MDTVFAPLHRRLMPHAVAAVICGLAICGSRAGAQELSDTERYGRIVISQFAGVSGYWFTSSSAVRAIGTPKFGGDATFYVRPAHRLGGLLTGGVEVAGANDHWLPFTGGNSFSLTGASAQWSAGHRQVNKVVPFIRAGLFAGNIHSELQHFDHTTFVPSVAVGADFKLHRYVTLSASYRWSGDISGVSTDGFNASFHLF